jgi:hypothetical protein
MPLQNPHLALGGCQHRVTLWIASSLLALRLVGSARKLRTPAAVSDVAKPVRADIPVDSEWIGATGGSSTPKSSVFGLIPLTLVLEPGSERYPPACTCSFRRVERVQGRHRISGAGRPPSHSSQEVRDDEIEARSGEVIHA